MILQDRTHPQRGDSKRSGCAAIGNRRFTYGSVFQGSAGDRGGPAADAMTSVIEADLLNLTMASLGALSQQTPDAWLEMALPYCDLI